MTENVDRIEERAKCFRQPNILIKTPILEAVKADGRHTRSSALEAQRRQCFEMAEVGDVRSREKCRKSYEDRMNQGLCECRASGLL